MKKCNSCDELKNINDFYSSEKYSKKKGNYIYHHPECKSCTSERAAKWQREHPDRHSASRKRYIVKDSARKLVREQGVRSRERGTRLQWQRDNQEKAKEYSKRRLLKKHSISTIEWEACKLYFAYRCVYCKISYEDHFEKYKEDLHKDHLDVSGENDLSNCVPACKVCNSSKHDFDFEWWFKERSGCYTIEKHTMILKWIEDDHKKYIAAIS